MYIATLRIQNYRCFKDSTIEFRPGLNVIIGENNSGKTTLLKALALVFNRRSQSRPTVHDFHSLLEPIDTPPRITISVTLRSSTMDTPADRAVVASWLTSLAGHWEAQLTYAFFLPDTEEAAFKEALNETTDRATFFEVVDEFLPKYVTRVYGGNPETVVTADAETLSKFDCQFVDALRDVESEMFSGTNPLLRQMLEEVLDFDKKDEEKRALRSAFRNRSKELRAELAKRLDTPRLFQLVSETGAGDGGQPKLDGGIQESDLIAALKLFIERESFALPATHQGLGYNNLLYISLLLASMAFRASVKRRGQNAAVFPMLLIEEPEAHLHPAAKYSKQFDEVFTSGDVEIKRNTPMSPNLRAHVERFIQSLKHECLDKFVIVSERHLNHVNRQWRLHFIRERSHSARHHLPPACESPPEPNSTIRLSDVVCHTRVGRAAEVLRAACRVTGGAD